MSPATDLTWNEDGQQHSARWQSEAGLPPPRKVQAVDDTLPADQAYRLACEGTALLWRGDYHNARQLLQALARRLDRSGGKKPARPAASAREAFHQHRQTQGQRARVLGMVLIPVTADYRIPLRRAPDVAQACVEAYGPAEGDFVVSLREIQALVGAHEWRKKGIEVAALGGRIHPWYGVFSPLRGEYLDLLAAAPLPPALATDSRAFDIGTGTGVIAALLARRGIARVIATDLSPRALGCAGENLERLGVAPQVELQTQDLFPPGQAPLVVCNPPWVPAKPTSPVEYAVFDPDSRMLRGFLAGLAAHLCPGGEGWLIISDLAEHLGLRSREELLSWIAAAGLQVLERRDIRPRHPKSQDASDPLHIARAKEITSLWRLAAA
ncbi:methylase [Azospira sp. I13]|uniref:methyltransferase n=1 Tax=Azospira sp. I13 TaxID=1765050 RepID=UPI000D4A529F|nr:class I SAM-dependent methyltransferase [Azospira sp. I13]GBG03159.1 methylase [Azospira sp. I13]